MVAAAGVPVLDADAVVHRLYGAGEPGSRLVGELFGNAALAADGGVDRAALARLVLADAAARGRLEAAVHPLVRRRVAGWLADLEDHEIAVVEAALLVETGSYRDYDLLLVVWCEPEQQLERALARGVPAERARRILEAQLPLADKVALADVAVDNRGDIEALVGEVERRWAEVVDRCAGRRRSAGQPAAGSSHSVR